jgi:hypothetical protein
MIVDPKARFNRASQVIGWERGRPARSEREARNRLSENDLQNLRAFGVAPDRTPTLPAIT